MSEIPKIYPRDYNIKKDERGLVQAKVENGMLLIWLNTFQQNRFVKLIDITELVDSVTGPKGDKGDTGLQGADGAAGEPGIDGIDGRSPEFNVGETHVQWRLIGDETWIDLVSLLSLKGADGEDGVQGIQGIKGDTGLQGETGPQGIKGDTGSQGLQGNDGAQGPQGIQGIQGEPGSQGIQGTPGINGTNGQGVPVGGTAGQVLSKTDGTNYNAQWISISKSVVNQSVAAQGPGFASDTYLTGSGITIPSDSLNTGTRYHLIFDVSKTAAGTATPIITIRFGTAGSTADTARLTFTFLAQTAVADIGTFEIWLTFRTVGASAIIQGTAQVRHRLSVTGLQNLVSTTLQVTSASFNSGIANSIVGASVNGGTNAAWTVQLVQAELSNIN